MLSMSLVGNIYSFATYIWMINFQLYFIKLHIYVQFFSPYLNHIFTSKKRRQNNFVGIKCTMINFIIWKFKCMKQTVKYNKPQMKKKSSFFQTSKMTRITPMRWAIFFSSYISVSSVVEILQKYKFKIIYLLENLFAKDDVH